MSEKRFGNYDLLEKIAVGGMAEIYRARSVHGRGIEKNIVIKRIHPALSADKNFVAMFIDEARLGVKMAHGNIVPVFDFGCVDGYYFLAMEFVEGRDLSALRGRSRMVGKEWPHELALYVVMEVLEGLEYAHQQRDDEGRPLDLVHRDVSPANILVSNDGQVKLLDFGIARSEASEYETRTGVIKGKPGYMSPEQAAGKKVDSRSDIWSCGAVLHELITGRRLKDGRIKTNDESIDAVLDKALAADREKRYSNSREFQKALGHILIERNARPTSGDLAEFVKEVTTSNAKAENWDMTSTEVEKHLAAALSKAEELGSRVSEVLEQQQIETVDRANQPQSSLVTSTTINRQPDTEAKAETEPGTHPNTQILSRTQATIELPVKRNKKLPVAIAASLAVIIAVGTWLGYKNNQEIASPAPQPDTTNLSKDQDSIVPVDAQLILSSNPQGAKIFVNGKETQQKTEATLTLKPGDYLVELNLEGYRPWSKNISLKAGKESNIDTTLVASHAAVNITTTPGNATVFIDGAEQGKSPLALSKLAPGKHRVEAHLPGRIRATQDVFLVAGATKDVAFVLKEKKETRARIPATPALLTINTIPWSYVTLDGKSLGATPIKNYSLAPGTHRIVMTNPASNLTKKETFSIKAGEKKFIKRQL